MWASKSADTLVLLLVVLLAVSRVAMTVDQKVATKAAWWVFLMAVKWAASKADCWEHSKVDTTVELMVVKLADHLAVLRAVWMDNQTVSPQVEL